MLHDRLLEDPRDLAHRHELDDVLAADLHIQQPPPPLQDGELVSRDALYLQRGVVAPLELLVLRLVPKG